MSKAASYTPTVNQDLVSLRSIPREPISSCNNEAAFGLKDRLQVSVPGTLFGRKCVPYSNKAAIKLLLHNLSANKHIDVSKVVPPMQVQSNCWFNTMFVVLFVSDKGRKFFHYFRQLMIVGKQANGTRIPGKLRDAFALLNYAVESALAGNAYAYELDTNNITRQIYDAIPAKYRESKPYIVREDMAGNPIRYYQSILNYLGDHSLDILFITNITANPDWKRRVQTEIGDRSPHLIILEFFDLASVHDKVEVFQIDGLRYELDSAVVRDTGRQHFCATLTADGKQMAYDGVSFHRLVPLRWKPMINTAKKWTFEGVPSMSWVFLAGYQMLLYYRV